MPKFDATHFQSIDEYKLAGEAFAAFTSQLLFHFGDGPGDVKNQIIKNFIARTVKSVRSVMALWTLRDIQGCLILHRCLVDRYFHLVEIGKSSSYQAFDDWSFMQMYKVRNTVRSDERFKEILNSPLFKPTPEQKARYAALTKSPPQWRRPKAEDVAKEMGLSFLYSINYDYASSHIHPMSTDGWEDFYDITKLEPRPDFPPQISTLHNTLLIACLLVMEGLKQSDYQWITLVSHFYDHMMKHLDNGSPDYKVTFSRFAMLGPEAKLSEPVSAPKAEPGDSGDS